MHKGTPSRPLRTAGLGIALGLGGLVVASTAVTSAPAYAWGTPAPSVPSSPAAGALVAPTVNNTGVLPGVANRFSGTATPGATLQVGFLTGWQSFPHDILVAQDGTWSFDYTVPVGTSPLLLRFVQTLGEREDVSGVFTLEAGAGTPAPETPAELIAPTVTTASVDAGSKERIAGVATPGAYLTVVDGNGRPLVPGEIRAGDDGTWSFEYDIPSTSDTLSFRLEQSLGDKHQVSELLSVRVSGASTPIVHPELVAPTVSNTTFTAGVTTRFSGTATPGATLHVGFLTGWLSYPHDITVDQDGAWSFDYAVPAGTGTLLLRFSQTLGGSESVSDIITLTPAHR